MVPRLAFGSLRELFSAITENRLEMLRFVATNENLNTRQLSQQLGRDYKNVYTFHNNSDATTKTSTLTSMIWPNSGYWKKMNEAGSRHPSMRS